MERWCLTQQVLGVFLGVYVMNLSGILYPLIPAVYAWQVYGFWIGASVFMAVALLLITLTCFNMNRGWVRLFVLILSCVAIRAGFGNLHRAISGASA